MKEQTRFISIEKKWQYIWQKKFLHKWYESQDNHYSIDTPPPTISGMLHMGHVFSYSQVDSLARFYRMLGYNIFYTLGFDNNGLPTERLIEKIKKIKLKQLSLKKIRKIFKSIISDMQKSFRNLYKSLGLSFDWSQEYQTIDGLSRKISQISFLDFYFRKKIIRKKAPFFWDINDRTAISQGEIIDKNKEMTMYTIKFHTINIGNTIISTTRPELLSACVAIFCHYRDRRYINLIREKIIVPLFKHNVFIFSDIDINFSKGTGLMMCSTFGNINDVTFWKKYKLNTISCINLKGNMKNAKFLNYLNIIKARKLILQYLNIKNLIIKQKKILYNVKCVERSGKSLEIISTYQWYIRIIKYKKYIDKKKNNLTWYPKSMQNKLINWIQTLNQEWCISRQRYFGISFPLWNVSEIARDHKVIIPKIEDLPINSKHDIIKKHKKDNKLMIKKDIIDTWATSSLTPQISSLGINKNFIIDKNRYLKLFPFNLRPQSHEIIRTWTFLTIVKAILHQNRLPWYNIIISGWCKINKTIKMSKSKNTLIDPKKLLKQYGADVIRYWSCHFKVGEDIIYNEITFRLGQKCINKLWNISRLIRLCLTKKRYKPSKLPIDIFNEKIIYELDIFTVIKLYQLVHNTTIKLKKYKYWEAKHAIEKFLYYNFCNDYLNLIKQRLYLSHNKLGSKSCTFTINYTFQTILILFSPFIPHITDEIYLFIFNSSQSINKSFKWPKLYNIYFDKKIFFKEKMIRVIFELIKKYKIKNNFISYDKINVVLYHGIKLSHSCIQDLKNTTNTYSMIHTNNTNVVINKDHK